MNQLSRQAIRVRIVEPGGTVIFRADVPAEIVDGVIVVPGSAFELEEGAQLEVADNSQPHATSEVAPDDVINRD